VGPAIPVSHVARTSDGTQIAWTERGFGKPLLLVMGLGASGTAWELHVEALARDFRCLIIDNRGTGGSDAPVGPYSVPQLADDAVSVLDDADVASAAVIGISMGGAIAQELALRHPERVRALILTASWATTSPVTADTFRELAALRVLLTPAEHLRRLQLLIWSPGAYVERHEAFDEERRLASEFPMAEHAFLAQADACLHHDARARLGQIGVPTLITAGDLDVFTPLSESEQLHALITDSRLEVFEGSGHAHHWEQLERYNALCKEFLSGW